jgi:hypothetical protein
MAGKGETLDLALRHRGVWLSCLAGALTLGCAGLFGSREAEIQLYFLNLRLPEQPGDYCDTGEFVTRTVSADQRTPDVALRLLFAGPTPAEAARGAQPTEPFAEYYLGVSIRGSLAQIEFRKGADEPLHVGGPSCMTAGSLAPIVRTLAQFGVRSVEYYVEGIGLVDYWDG